ncbi:hypothetical protein GTV32_19945 [Gordonia sp. SID5947]|uniref:hypothetical protein n=1 Tax=Gordonia sp. SID5947 TaxID=2690315 RepID=UPI00136DE751|nr:hypothetical protein [Gordonia sp. SID5947]MYR08432.1 hypothetical protein [Gordonia sp. SID5947]
MTSDKPEDTTPDPSPETTEDSASAPSTPVRRAPVRKAPLGRGRKRPSQPAEGGGDKPASEVSSSEGADAASAEPVGADEPAAVTDPGTTTAGAERASTGDSGVEERTTAVAGNRSPIASVGVRAPQRRSAAVTAV